jgi:hypothetical protein
MRFVSFGLVLSLLGYGAIWAGAVRREAFEN